MRLNHATQDEGLDAAGPRGSVTRNQFSVISPREPTLPRSDAPTLRRSNAPTLEARHESRLTHSSRRSQTKADHASSAFTLLEVIIACSIFFMVAFAILGMVTSGLSQAKALQQREPDAGMLAASLSLTNQLEEGVESGDFRDLAGDLYRDYRWSREVTEVASNGLFQVDFVIYGNFGKRRSSESKMSLLMFRPGSKPGRNFGTGVGR